ncbi:5-oxoprolinase subunit PxpB [Luteimonas sp. M1R5S18]|uniref:5-oxoprolinase subunit PxpB n=1 Tax=Luteimonas rhizosphaericola TaxID=3042024 RepID=A0ABT6JFK4_9GAMM|nr:5-oxoprolinase subunit PxpB [Luteimonas rhizosphaericola]MDH5829465.1 5-oxoprolinase subunit PxpB [Luteimonas rhizosphaericola]
MSGVAIEPLGEDALLLRLDRRIDPAVNARVHALARRIEAARWPWVREVVPAYASLAVCLAQDACDDAGGIDATAEALRVLLAGGDDPDDARAAAAPPIEIPVCHAPAFAPDLDAVAAHAGLSTAEVIALHCAGDYRVAMTGFAPGFPYLLGLDPRLAMPRRGTPRTRVPAGSVAIGGAQTGIYPREGPGGWQLIGRTPVTLFDPHRDPPCLLSAGARVRFVAIDEDAFRAASGDRAP